MFVEEIEVKNVGYARRSFVGSKSKLKSYRSLLVGLFFILAAGIGVQRATIGHAKLALSAVNSAPTNLTAVASSTSEIDLQWQGSSSNGFQIERCLGATCTNFISIATNWVGNFFANTGLSQGTTYRYRVAAIGNGNKLSAYSNIASATTLVATATPTPTPAASPQPTPTPTPASGTNLAIGATASASSIYGVGYEASQANDGNFATRWNSQSGLGMTGQWLQIDFGVARTFNETITFEYGNRITGYTIDYWNGSSWLTAFSGTTVGSNKTDTFSVVTAQKVRIYVTAGNADTVSIYEFEVHNNSGAAPTPTPTPTPTATPTPAPSPTPSTTPAAPINLVATAVSSSQINLTWTDNSTNETGFKVYRCNSACSDFAQIATLGANVTSYQNTGLAASALYYYWVKSYNTAGESAYSNSAQATTPSGSATPTPTPCATPAVPSNLVASAVSISQINLTWTDNSTNESGFRVERALVSTGPWTQIADLTANITSLGNTGLSANTMYYYRVYAYNTCGNSGYTIVASAVTLLPPPANPATNMTSSSFTANWGSGSTGTTGYLLDVATNSSFTSYVSGYQNLNVGNVQNRNVSGLGAGTYYYRLQSYSLVGASADSNVVSATTVVTSTPTPTPTPSSSPWSKSFGSTAGDVGQAVAFDSGGNLYMTGYFQGTVNFGGTCGTLSSNSSSADILLAKYSATGTCLWAKDFGGTNTDQGNSVAVDSSGNVIVTGYFIGTANFGGGSVTGLAGYNIFVAKYASDGTYQWAKTFGDTTVGGSGYAIAYGVAVDTSGNVAITGRFADTIDFGGGSITAASGGYRNVFVAEFNSAGGHQWSKGFSTPVDDYAWGIDMDGGGNVLITGQFKNTIDFGCGSLTSAGGYDVFVAKFSSSGSCSWSKRFGDASDQVGTGVAVDSSGNVYLTGYFQGTVNFGGSDIVGYCCQNNIYLAKLSSAGNHLWSKKFGVASESKGYSIATDSSNNVAITGVYSGNVDFGGGPISGSSLYTNVFVAKYDSNGNYLSANGFVTTTGGSQGSGVAMDGSGNIGMTGYFLNSIDFGQGTLTSTGALDGFLVKRGP
jgi:F5/8 type C domain/Beta-propeller repeat/Fibronectin type III domain